MREVFVCASAITAGKVAVGGWHYTSTFDELRPNAPAVGPNRHRGSSGGYLLAEAAVPLRDDGSGEQARLFVQIGAADPHVNRFGFYAGAGATIGGLLPTRDDDEVGLAVAAARNGAAYLDASAAAGLAATRTETTLEWTYLAQITAWTALQVGLQYVIHPGTDPALGNAWVGVLRAELSL
jgi:porin